MSQYQPETQNMPDIQFERQVSKPDTSSKKAFLSIGQLFAKKASVTNPQEIKADGFFYQHEYGNICKMIQKGYKLSAPQEKLFNQAVMHMLVPNVNHIRFDELEKCLNAGLTLTHTEIAQAMIDWGSHIKNYRQKLTPILKHYLNEKVNEPGFSKTWFNEAQAYIFENLGSRFAYRENIANRLDDINISLKEYTKTFLKEVSYNEFFSFCKKVNKLSVTRHVYPESQDTLNEIIENYYTQDRNLSRLASEKNMSLSSALDSTLKSSNIWTKAEVELSELDDDTLTSIAKIQSIYEKINASRVEIEPDRVFQLTNLYEKRLPEIVQRYLSMDKEYRQTLTNAQGQNAQDLMHESLHEIQLRFSDVLKNINEQKFKTISALNRYTKSI